MRQSALLQRSRASRRHPIIDNDLPAVDDLGPEERRLATRNPHSPLTLVISILATIGVLAYGAFLLNPANRGDFIPWILVVIAETVLVFHALMSMWTMLAGYGKQPSFAFHDAQAKLYRPTRDHQRGVGDDPTEWPLYINGRKVSVDVLITVYGEPLDVIRRTAEAALNIHGKHQTYILDDGDSDAVRDLAATLGCGYIRRMGNSGAKAGNVNNALSVAKGDFFVIFDADFVAAPEFLEETLPYMSDGNVAFVQTPQVYGNLHNIISRGAGYMQSMFYRFVQPGRNQFNAAFCVGTNVLFRRAAVMDIGGMYTQSKSEDVWTSLMLHERGWRSVFIARQLAVGDAPETIEAYAKQQLRWATGGFEILLTHNLFGRRRQLSMDQRLQYFVTATHYLTGIAPGILLLVPALEVFFDLRPVNLDIPLWQWALAYLGFYLLQIVLAAVIAGSFRPEVLLLAANSFPIYIKAFRNAYLGVDTRWSVTGATGGLTSAFNFIRVQVYTFIFLLCTTLVSLWRDYNQNHVNLATVWAGINTLIVGAFIRTAFLEDARARKARKARLAGKADDVPATAVRARKAPRRESVPVLDRSLIEQLRAAGEPEQPQQGRPLPDGIFAERPAAVEEMPRIEMPAEYAHTRRMERIDMPGEVYERRTPAARQAPRPPAPSPQETATRVAPRRQPVVTSDAPTTVMRAVRPDDQSAQPHRRSNDA